MLSFKDIVQAGHVIRCGSEASLDSKVGLNYVTDRSGCIPLDRWDTELMGNSHINTYVPRFSCMMQGIEGFDAVGFGVSPPEALYMDPQQRLLLEASVELSFQTFGSGNSFAVETGSYVGASWMDYSDLLQRFTGSLPSPYSASGMLPKACPLF